MTDATIALRVAITIDGTEGRGDLDVAFEVPPGITVLFGPSGAGKSRTLSCIAGMMRPTRGRIALGDDVWFDAGTRAERPIHERRLAFVVQSLALFPHLTAAENVAYGIDRALPRERRRMLAMELLKRMHVEALADRRPRTFSGGEAQRVALARAFAIQPRAVLLDEPFSALDAAVKTELLREVGRELAALAVPTIFVTHQPEDAEILGDRVVFLEKGRVTRTAAMGDHPFR